MSPVTSAGHRGEVGIGFGAASARSMRAAVENDGFVLLRGAIPQDRVSCYREELDEIYRRHREAPEDFSAFNRDEVSAIARGDVTPGLFATLCGMTLEGYFEDARFAELVDETLVSYVPTFHTFMTVAATPGMSTAGIGMHTDGIIQGTSDTTLVFWSPLHACGVDAPGLRLVPAGRESVQRYLQKKFPTKQIPGWCSPTEWNDTGAFEATSLESEFGPAIVPEMQPGDAIVFTNWTIHGSHVLPTMTHPRSAVILRWRGALKPI